jgi:hypothetical protein
MYIVLIFILLLLLCGSYPAFGFNSGWGYGPFGGLLGIVLIVLVVLALTGRL